MDGCRDRQAAEHTHGGGLPCPVCPEEAEYLARLHLETDMIDGGEGAETLGQLFYFYRFHFLSLFHNYNVAFFRDSTTHPTQGPAFPRDSTSRLTQAPYFSKIRLRTRREVESWGNATHPLSYKAMKQSSTLGSRRSMLTSA